MNMHIAVLTLLAALPLGSAAQVPERPPRTPKPAPVPRAADAPKLPSAPGDTPPPSWKLFEPGDFPMKPGFAPRADMRFELDGPIDMKFHVDTRMDLEMKAHLDATRAHELELKHAPTPFFDHKFDLTPPPGWEGKLYDFPTPPQMTMPSFGFGPDAKRSGPRPAWSKDDPADSLYRVARELMNRGEYRRASQIFRDITQRFPRSDYAPDAFYWQAFALYRIGTTQDLEEALKAFDLQQERYPQAKTQADAPVLKARILGVLASRGNSQAAQRLEREAAQSGNRCDPEDQAVRMEALGALSQTSPESVLPSLRRVLSKKDECSTGLRKRAIFLLGQRADTAASDILGDAARSENDPEVRVEAIRWLPKMPGDRSLSTLEEILKTTPDERIQRAAISAIANHPSSRAKTALRGLIERTDASEQMRRQALSTYDKERSTPEDAAYLRSLYGRLESYRMKESVLNSIARLGGPENEQWLVTLVRNAEQPTELRASALRNVSSSSGVAIGDVVKMYDGLAERQLREQLISVYSHRKEPEATDKLFDIVKNGTDPNLRRQAIEALRRKNDPRTTKLLLEIIG